MATQEGGKWYHDNREQGAQLLNAAGESVATVEIGTKESIGHGVGFWPSPITFPGNIERIKEFIYENGVDYDYAPNDSIVKNADGVWTVCDTVTGATMASNAIMRAASAAAKAAGLDANELKANAYHAQPGAAETWSTDVLVIGGGGAGLSAAISAARTATVFRTSSPYRD